MQLQISPITLIIVLAYVSGLAFQIGRIYEQLRQAKQKAVQQNAHQTATPYCQHISENIDGTCPYCDLPKPPLVA